MTYEINSDYDQILLNSEYLDNLNQSVTLTIVQNCTTTTEIDVDVADTLIEIEPTDLAQTITFTESPYYFKLEIVQEDGTLVTEYLCKYIQPDGCTYISLFKDKVNLDKILALKGLETINTCEQCSCTNACVFYATLTETECNDCTCGCS